MHELTRHVAPATFGSKMDAEWWLADERRLIERGQWTPPRARVTAARAQAVTVDAYARDWLKTRDLKARTLKGYEELLDGPLAAIGAVALGSLTSEAVRSWYAGLDKATPTRRAHAYSLLHAVLATAVVDGRIAANPCVLTRAMSAPAKRQPVILEPVEVAKLADAISPERLRALVLVAAWCGLRWGELVELRRSDVETTTGGDLVLVVSRAVTHRSGQCVVSTPKSGRGRRVIVPPHIRDDVTEHLVKYVGAKPDSLAFPAVHGCHLNDRVFRDYWNDALKSIGREGVRVHDLRHFAGTQAARVGNLRETMDRLGHSTVKASLMYQQIASGRDREVAEGLSALAKPTPKRDNDIESDQAG